MVSMSYNARQHREPTPHISFCNTPSSFSSFHSYRLEGLTPERRVCCRRVDHFSIAIEKFMPGTRQCAWENEARYGTS